MARPRRPPGTGPPPKHVSILSKWSSSGSGESSPARAAPRVSLVSWQSAVGTACLAVAVYIGALGYLETRVNTPLDEEKAVTQSGLEVPDRYWGSYRPGVYFGLRTRSPRSPLLGLMWYDPGRLATNQAGIRHWCEQADGLPSYGWLRHDGVTFGEQRILDPPFVLTTSFVKTPGGQHGGRWTARVAVTHEKVNHTGEIALLWYAALDESPGSAAPESRLRAAPGAAIVGHTEQLGNFRITLAAHEGGEDARWSYSEARAQGVDALKERIIDSLRVVRRDNRNEIVLSDDADALEGGEPNLVAVQVSARTPLTLDIVYEVEGAAGAALRGDAYTAALRERRREFARQFDDTFRLQEKGYSASDVGVARAALSNLLGGIGYMYGAGRVRSMHTSEPVPYWRAPLYTAVPSRSFFPRGFLWDEGFHGLLVGRWSPEIALDIAAHWFDLINVEGWIPREQILGVEAAARVPKEYVVQSNAAANPPMFLLQIAALVRARPLLFARAPHRDTLRRLFPRLQAWYQWFHTTQKGPEATSFRWRGREDNGLELNPKTLTSGLDDYPRASHPSEIERHVDLRCWMYAAADAMLTIAAALDRDTDRFEATRDQLADEELLNELHWSAKTQSYADYGLHTDGVRLARAPRQTHDAPSARAPPAPLVRVVAAPPQPRLVTSAFGYISLFPMLLKVLKPESEKLGKILHDLDRPELLWSPYGLRSLSKSAPLYMKRNTEHDPPYWRGQVWLNINYLALAALRHYAGAPGPHAERAATLHAALRGNVVGNVISEYKSTGYLWEQYSGEDGRGSGCRPFTGWTSLLVLIMADEY